MFSRYFIYLLIHFFAWSHATQTSEKQEFQLIHQWQFLNYTWPSSCAYKDAIKRRHYIPKNNAPTGMKIHNDKIFLSIPRHKPGIPATLAYVFMVDQGMKSNQLLTPYPNWDLNIEGICEGLQSVQSMEIDKQGHMWVIDGERQNVDAKCPAKLLILDLNNHGNCLHTYIFPNEIALSKGGFLNDIVLDDVEGGYAYMTDSSSVDPGLVVYCRKEDRSWKLRDPSMFPVFEAANFKVNNIPFEKLIPIDGIALSPSSPNEEKLLFFCALVGFNLYSIDTSTLRNESFARTDQWRRNVELIGQKQSESDGLMIDSRGDLYYTLLPLNGIGKWNINTPFASSEIIYRNDDEMIWPDTFAMDEKGFLYLISNHIYQFISPNAKPTIRSEFKFRIFRLFTGTKSYKFNKE